METRIRPVGEISMRVLLIGLPGSGKTTQGGRLAEQLNLPHISTGNMVRSLMREGSSRGMAAADYVVSGRFTPDEIIVPMLRERLAESDWTFMRADTPACSPAAVAPQVLEVAAPYGGS
jgi:adenylate kinase family enzyme